jgi:hypothetical protein
MAQEQTTLPRNKGGRPKTGRGELKRVATRVLPVYTIIAHTAKHDKALFEVLNHRIMDVVKELDIKVETVNPHSV